MHEKSASFVPSGSRHSVIQTVPFNEISVSRFETTVQHSEFLYRGLYHNISSNIILTLLSALAIRCLSNTIQLCILDTLKESFTSEIMDDMSKTDAEDYRKVIRDVRTIVKELLTQHNLVQLKRADLTKLALDSPTR